MGCGCHCPYEPGAVHKQCPGLCVSCWSFFFMPDMVTSSSEEAPVLFCIKYFTFQ